MKKTLLAAMAVILMAGCNMNEKRQTEADVNDNDTTLVTNEGVEAPDFTLKTPDGSTLTLSSLRGQYVVLDFWGTWCKWCVKGIPDMKAYYKKYEGMFEMVSIDFHDDEDTWLKAIDSFEMDWLHVITDEESAIQLQEDYSIEGFPTKIVIDPEGTIIHTTVGEDPAFYKYLDELFSEG